MYLRDTWAHRAQFVLAAAVAVFLVVGAGNMLGQVFGETIALASDPSSSVHGYDYYGAVAAAALFMGIGAGIAAFRFLAAAFRLVRSSEDSALPTGAGRS